MSNSAVPTPCVVYGDLNIVRALALGQVPVLVATSIANRATFSSRYCRQAQLLPSPTRQPAAFIEALVAFGRQFGDRRPVLYYNGDSDLMSISRHRRELEPYYRFNLPDPELVEDCVDKIRFLGLADRHNLPIPRTIVYRAGGDSNPALLSGLRFPCIVKPARRGDWFASEVVRRLGRPQKAIEVRNLDELEALLPLMAESAGAFVIQEQVRGAESNILSYHCYADVYGRIRGEYTGRKIRTFPSRYGVSSCVEIEDEQVVKDIGRDIVQRIGLRGVAKLDFKIDAPTGELKLLEINPRFSLWNYPGACAGVNLPLLAYRDLVDGDAGPAPRVERRVKWLELTTDVRSYLELRAQGRLAFNAWIRSLRGRRVYPIWSWRDPIPLLVHASRSAARLAVRAGRRVVRRRGAAETLRRAEN